VITGLVGLIASADAVPPPPIYNWICHTGTPPDVARHFTSEGCNDLPVMNCTPGIFIEDYDNNDCGPCSSSCNCTAQPASEWGAFAELYYQSPYDCATGTADPDYAETFETLPITYPDAMSVVRGNGAGALAPPTYAVSLVPVPGLDAIRTIPLDKYRGQTPPSAAARFTLAWSGQASITPDTISGALFFLTANYDPAVFQVTVHHEQIDAATGASTWNVTELKTEAPVWFQPSVPAGFYPSDIRDPNQRVIGAGHPAYVRVRMRGNRALDPFSQDRVMLQVHTLRWVGGATGGVMPTVGDKVTMEKTDERFVEIDQGAGVQPWPLRSVDLTYGAPIETLDDAQVQEAEAVATLSNVLGELNNDLPALKTGLCRWRARPMLADTLAADARVYRFGPSGDPDAGTFILMNTFGVPFGHDDIPDWDFEYFAKDATTDLLCVRDGWARRSYDFQTTDADADTDVDRDDYEHADATPKLVGVDFDYPASALGSWSGPKDRLFDYPSGDLDQPVEKQSGDGVEISYDHGANPPLTNPTADWSLTVTATGRAGEGVRKAQLVFGPALDATDPYSRPLKSAVHLDALGGTAGGRTYLYETTAGPALGKLKKIEFQGVPLAEFNYDGEGQLIEITRGASAETIAEFEYTTGVDWYVEYSVILARFYTDATNYQSTAYEFFPNGVRRTREHEALQNSLPDMSDSALPRRQEAPCIGINPWCGEYASSLDNYPAQPGAGDLQLREIEYVLGEYQQYEILAEGFDNQVVESWLSGDSYPSPGWANPHAAVHKSDWKSFEYATAQNGVVWGLAQQIRIIDHDRFGATTEIDYYDDGRLLEKRHPVLTSGTHAGERLVETYTYQSVPDDKLVDTIVRGSSDGSTTTTLRTESLEYDEFEYLKKRTESFGGPSQEIEMHFNAFGQELWSDDADDNRTFKEYEDGSGLLLREYTHAAGIAGPVVREHRYIYDHGLLVEIWMADNPGPWTLGSPANWIVTRYEYADGYARVTSRCITTATSFNPGGLGACTGTTWDYAYDLQNRLTKITFPADASATGYRMTKSITRNGYGGIDQEEIGSVQGGIEWTNEYDYDDKIRLQTHRKSRSSSQLPAVSDYTYHHERGMLNYIVHRDQDQFGFTFAETEIYNYYYQTTTIPGVEQYMTRMLARTTQKLEPDPAWINTQRVHYAHDESGRAVTETTFFDPGDPVLDPAPAPDVNKDDTLHRDYDVQGNLVRETNEGGSKPDTVTIHGYDWRNFRTQTTDADGGVWVYEYDERGNVTREFTPVDVSTVPGTPQLGQVVAEHDYDGVGRRIETRYKPDGVNVESYVTYLYDGRGNKVRQTTFDAADTPLAEQRWTYNALGFNTQHARMLIPSAAPLASAPAADPAAGDRVTDTVFDDLGRVMSRTTYGHDASGTVVPRTTTFEYDHVGRLTKRAELDGVTEIVTEELYYTNPTAIQRGAQVIQRVMTDAAGVRTFTYTYDGLGRRLSETETVTETGGPLRTATTSYTYDALGRRLTVTDPANIVTEFTRDGRGQLTQEIRDVGGLAQTVDRQYNALGQLTDETALDDDGPDQSTSYLYDPLGRRTQITLPDTSTWSYLYDDAGRMLSRTDSRGDVTWYRRDGRGRLLEKYVKPSAGAYTLEESFTYDELGRRLTADRDATNKITFTYDPLGNLLSETQEVADVEKTLAYPLHDPSGNRTRVVYPADTSVTLDFTYDKLGNTTAIKRNTIGLITYPAYAGRSWTQRIIDFDGAGAVTLETTADRNTLSRRINQLALLGKLGGTTSWTDTIDYTRDDVGNPTDATRAGHPLTANDTDYDYDNLHRVDTVTRDGALAEDFDLDVLGNRTEYTGRDGQAVSYTHNEVNEYTNVSTQTAAPVHDANGNLTVNDRGFGFAYDYENRLTTIYEDADADGALDAGEPILATYTYDALGRRTSETRTDAIANGTTYYYYDGERIVAEYDATDTLTRYYVHGETYVDEHAIVHEAASAEDYAYAVDDMYNVVGLVDDTGELVAGYIYDAYGLPQYRPLLIGVRNHLGESAAAYSEFDVDNSGGIIDLVDLAIAAKAVDELPNPADGAYTFQGRRLSIYQTASGATLPIYDFRARAYDPILGRFMQHDPEEYTDSYNLYLAFLANALTIFDPMGTNAWNEDFEDWLGDYTGQNLYSLASINEGARWASLGLKMTLEIAKGFIPGSGLYDAFKAVQVINDGGGGFWEAISIATAALPVVKGVAKGIQGFRGLARARRIGFRACNCFVAGTRVDTPDGSRPIEAFRIGDLVITRNQQEPDSTPIVGKVTHLFRNVTPVVLWVTLATGDVIGTTPGHEVWTHRTGWGLARDLTQGDTFVDRNGMPVEITDIILDHTPTPVYNLEVDGTYTYFVHGVWVHNKSCKIRQGKINNAYGHSFEMAVRQMYDLPAYGGPRLTHGDTNFVPDFLGNGMIGEIKGGKYITQTKQLRAIADYAGLHGLRPVLYVTGKYSKWVKRTFDVIEIP
jgi:RHS repeat-associated protein